MLSVVLFIASVLAGAINSVAGGGTLLTFPALLAVLGPIEANATSTVALIPGTIASAAAYRGQLAPVRPLLGGLALASVLGGALGAVLLTWFPEAVFRNLVPWLLLLSAVVLSARSVLVRLGRGGAGSPGEPERIAFRWLWLLQFTLSIYGGYFGAGLGILSIAAYGLVGMRDIHRMNALKTLLGAATNCVAAALFVAQGRVEWKYALLMAGGSIVGGYVGARLSLRIERRYVQAAVVVIAYGLTIYFFVR